MHILDAHCSLSKMQTTHILYLKIFDIFQLGKYCMFWQLLLGSSCWVLHCLEAMWSSAANDYIIDVHTENGWTCVLWDSGWKTWLLDCILLGVDQVALLIIFCHSISGWTSLSTTFVSWILSGLREEECGTVLPHTDVAGNSGSLAQKSLACGLSLVVSC